MEVIRWTTSRFEERGIATPRLDAELLVAHALGLPRVQLYVQFDRPLDQPELAAIRELVRRRQAGESVAYVTAKKEFWGLELAVDARVLVPRPDTETLVDEALARIGRTPPAAAADGDGPAGPRLADVGTGSGAIAIALAKARPDAAVLAVDISADALAVARANAARHGAAVTFLEGDLLGPLAPHAPLALIAANLPYVPAGDIEGLAPEVRAEPLLALDGGPDGLALVRRLVAGAPALLAPGGALALEVGAGQAREAAALLEAAGLHDLRIRRDLGEIERVVSGVRPCPPPSAPPPPPGPRPRPPPPRPRDRGPSGARSSSRSRRSSSC
jgi:release factor glutamine methyltransferase